MSDVDSQGSSSSHDERPLISFAERALVLHLVTNGSKYRHFKKDSWLPAVVHEVEADRVRLYYDKLLSTKITTVDGNTPAISLSAKEYNDRVKEWADLLHPNKPTASEKQSKTPEKPSKIVEQQSKASEKQSKTPEKQSKTPEKQSKTPERQSDAPEKQQITDVKEDVKVKVWLKVVKEERKENGSSQAHPSSHKKRQREEGDDDNDDQNGNEKKKRRKSNQNVNRFNGKDADEEADDGNDEESSLSSFTPGTEPNKVISHLVKSLSYLTNVRANLQKEPDEIAVDKEAETKVMAVLEETVKVKRIQMEAINREIAAKKESWKAEQHSIIQQLNAAIARLDSEAIERLHAELPKSKTRSDELCQDLVNAAAQLDRDLQETLAKKDAALRSSETLREEVSKKIHACGLELSKIEMALSILRATEAEVIPSPMKLPAATSLRADPTPTLTPRPPAVPTLAGLTRFNDLLSGVALAGSANVKEKEAANLDMMDVEREASR